MPLYKFIDISFEWARSLRSVAQNIRQLPVSHFTAASRTAQRRARIVSARHPVVRKVSTAEAVLRGMVVGAMKGDPRSLGALFKLAEQTGQLENQNESVNRIERVIVYWKGPGAVPEAFPDNSDISRD
jgi:hypothetical protein